jgi:hypothetical protein
VLLNVRRFSFKRHSNFKVGATGAVWIDADNNGKRDSAYDYAKQIFDSSKGDPGKIIRNLSSYDEAVAMQTAALLWKNGEDLVSPAVTKVVKNRRPTC